MNLPEKNMKSGKWWTHGVMLVTGCTKASPGCKNCWSETMHENREWDFRNVVFQKDRLARFCCAGKPKVFAIWNDLFHKDVKSHEILTTLNLLSIHSSCHKSMILTKRSVRMCSLVNYNLNSIGFIEGSWKECLPENIWLGVSIECCQFIGRKADLLRTKAAKRFLSIEPILGRIDLGSLEGISWVIVGCETGPNARLSIGTNPCIENVVYQCHAAGVPCWVKCIALSKDGRHFRASKNMSQWPPYLRVRQLPH